MTPTRSRSRRRGRWRCRARPRRGPRPTGVPAPRRRPGSLHEHAAGPRPEPTTAPGARRRAHRWNYSPVIRRSRRRTLSGAPMALLPLPGEHPRPRVARPRRRGDRRRAGRRSPRSETGSTTTTPTAPTLASGSRALAGSCTSPTCPPRDPQLGTLARPLPAGVVEAVPGLLWSHQVPALDLARAGRSVVVATGTGSGKSRCYQLAIGEAVTAPVRPGTGLVLFPTKAAGPRPAAGPHRRSACPGSWPVPTTATPRLEERTWIRKHANVVLTNPEMLHAGLLPAPRAVGHVPRPPPLRGDRRAAHVPRHVRGPRRPAAPPPRGASPRTTGPSRRSSAARPRWASRQRLSAPHRSSTWCR